MGTNLHAVWDYYSLGTAGFGADRKAVAPYADRLGALPWPPVTEAGHSAPEAWAGESCRLVDARGLSPAGTPQLAKAYLDYNRPLPDQPARQSAYRLRLCTHTTWGYSNPRPQHHPT